MVRPISKTLRCPNYLWTHIICIRNLAFKNIHRLVVCPNAPKEFQKSSLASTRSRTIKALAALSVLSNKARNLVASYLLAASTVEHLIRRKLFSSNDHNWEKFSIRIAHCLNQQQLVCHSMRTSNSKSFSPSNEFSSSRVMRNGFKL